LECDPQATWLPATAAGLLLYQSCCKLLYPWGTGQKYAYVNPGGMCCMMALC
jgi:hypothetical protein